MSPDKNGKRYSEWLAEFDYNEYFRNVPEFEIWYLDNALQSRPAVRYADWDNDGVNDSRDDPRIAAAYREGNVRHWKRIRESSPRPLLMGNSDDISSPEYRGILNGAFLESIIGESWSTETRLGWRAAMTRYRASVAQTAKPHIVGFNVHGESNDYARMRYGLTSCLLDDGHFLHGSRIKLQERYLV